MSFSIFGKKKEDEKPISSDNKSTADSLSKTIDTTVNTRDDLSSHHQGTELTHHGASLETISALEEVAILFSSKQVEVAELILQGLIQDEDTTEPNTSAWLMLFDLYQITNNQAKFEHLRLEYASKWIEISAPLWKISPTESTSTTATIDIKRPDQLLLPEVIEGDTQQLISTIVEFSGEHTFVQLNCSQLKRIDFTSCGQLLNGLIPISSQPNLSIEFHEVNHLVTALLSAMGFNSIAKIFPRQ